MSPEYFIQLRHKVNPSLLIWILELTAVYATIFITGYWIPVPQAPDTAVMPILFKTETGLRYG